MRAAGYETVGFISNYFFSDAVGFDKSYDKYEVFAGNSDDGGETGLREVETWLDKRRYTAAPFFMVFHIVDPHMPYRWRKEIAPEQWPPASDLTHVVWNESHDVARLARYDSKNAHRMVDVKKFYDAETRWADQVMQQLFDLLMPYDPVIAVMADHGEAFREHGKLIHGNTMYNEVVHVPLLLRLPGDKRGGTRVSTPVSLVDVAPTLLSLSGKKTKIPEAWRGISLLKPKRDRDMFLEGVYSDLDKAALIRWPFKLIWNFPEREVGFSRFHPFRGGFELYNMVDDAVEKRNLSAAKADLVAEMKPSLERFLMKTLNGTNIRCGAFEKETSMTFSTSRSINQVLAMTLEDVDKTELSADKMTLTFRPAPSDNDEDWLILRSALDELKVEATGPVDVVAHPPDAVPKGRCVMWTTVCGGNTGMSMSESELESLKALGYIV